MGCWGITAFESDAGLDAADFFRSLLPEDGKLELAKIIETTQKEDWWLPDADGESHTAPMALVEVLMKFLDQDISDLDYDEEWASDDNKFSAITSFIADKESILWLRDCLSETLRRKIENAEYMAEHGANEWDKWGGWFEEKNWHGWQNHMRALVSRLDTLLAFPESQIEIIQSRDQANGPVMDQSL